MRFGVTSASVGSRGVSGYPQPDPSILRLLHILIEGVEVPKCVETGTKLRSVAHIREPLSGASHDAEPEEQFRLEKKAIRDSS